MRDGHSSRTPVARRLQQPTRTGGSGHRSSRLRACAEGGTPSLFGLAPGGVCRAAGVAASAVRSYRTVSPLPRHTQRPRRSVLCGTFPGLAPAGCYPAPLVHGARTFLPGSLSASPERPSGRLTGRGMGGRGPFRQEAGRFSALRPRDAMVRTRPRVAIRFCSVARVDSSQTPSARSGRKWRWNAVTTAWVAES